MTIDDAGNLYIATSQNAVYRIDTDDSAGNYSRWPKPHVKIG